ncbi:HesB/IscA family protein [Blattabacterium punctulatus]|uniref:Iron-sulfur cluster assembly accessory protein n=1 Tax=Blattabacterium punctulatus TaxID=164514 RepID=A0ABM6WM33_9FLAO|nr:iron-sulfur cluster assembly accessory protein [Blattabacterium punctulatus]AWU39617.1 iron-sulfur cluster assembly accessory protein [Blattabacterium punctulatus]AWU40162.1 iron-sulfur cluster assembly accessory protein [Blattabacterium punctulatus]AWU42417.1 iron-sulfur cluster assembly accessory protein [Blattabacterium punctulatus]AWU44610.1 iron-sulfur cluster assembly accessory protein [Blattabacterium punctulatus]AWU45696.1 iron-sulfur cluster assembly accessory protein [Blattabacter
MVFISDQAKNKLISIMKEEGLSNDLSFVRFGVKNGGCSGLSYELTFDKKKKKEDKLFNYEEMKILVDENSFPYLVGITLEYSGGLNGKGFYFKNPNAKHTCGCGKSFSS